MAHQPHGLRYVNQQYAYGKPPIVVTDNDVLCGRGVNIAAHPGNERFRTLVTTRADENYCESYAASEKKALADEIVRHIASLDPPGRFLKREGRGQVSRGLNGPWEELSHKEAVKKTCQALRDCNRHDRETYAAGVAAPEDVKAVAEERAKSGLTGKDLAAKAAEKLQEENQKRLREAMEAAGVAPEQIEEQLKRQRTDPTYIIPGFGMSNSGHFTPVAFGHVPPGMTHAIGPDGMPIPASDPMSGVPVLFTPFPHPAVDAAPIDEAAQAAARAAAGYVHPDDRLAGAAEEAAAAVAGLDSAVQQQQELAQQVANTTGELSAEAQEAAEIAVAIAHDAVGALAHEGENPEGTELAPEVAHEGGHDLTHEAVSEVKTEAAPEEMHEAVHQLVHDEAPEVAAEEAQEVVEPTEAEKHAEPPKEEAHEGAELMEVEEHAEAPKEEEQEIAEPTEVEEHSESPKEEAQEIAEPTEVEEHAEPTKEEAQEMAEPTEAGEHAEPTKEEEVLV